MSVLEESNGTESDNPATYIWRNHEEKNTQEIFFVYVVNRDGDLEGRGFEISKSSEQAIPQITDILRQADTTFGSGGYHATTVLGLQLTNMEPGYLFNCLQANSTIFVGNTSTLAAYNSASTVAVSPSRSHQQAVTIEQASSDALAKRLIKLGKRKRYMPDDWAIVRYSLDSEDARKEIKGSSTITSSTNAGAKKKRPIGILNSKRASSS